ncbi:Probable transport protein MmpL10, partial [Durusdinium trenchii]
VWRKVVVAVWAVVLVGGLALAPLFMRIGNDTMEAPKGTDAYVAQKSFEERFPNQAHEIPVIVLVECVEASACDDVRSQEMTAFYNALKNEVWTYNASENTVLSIESWYEFNGTALDTLKAGFVNKDNRTSFINIMARSSNTTTVRHNFVRFLETQVKALNLQPHMYDIGVTGFDALNSENLDASETQILKVDLVTIPMAISILWYMVGSWRLLGLAVLNMVTSIATSFALVTLLVDGFGAPQPEPTATALLQCVCIALGTDYCLFLLRRFRDELERGATTSHAIYIMMLRAGHVVLMSGVTILLVMLAFVLIPTEAIRMDGVCCAVGIGGCMLVCLTLTPAMLYLAPDFFTHGIVDAPGSPTNTDKETACTALPRPGRCRPWSTCCERGEGAAFGSLDAEDEGTSIEDAQELRRQESALGERDMARDLLVAGPNTMLAEANPDAILEHYTSMEETSAVQPMYQTFRFRLTEFLTTFPNNVIAIVLLYLMVLPLALQILRLDVNQDILHVLPRGSQAAARLHRMYDEFPGGTFAPYYVLVNVPRRQGSSVWNPEIFHLVQQVSRRIVAETACTDAGLTSPAFVAGRQVSFLESELLLDFYKSDLCSLELINHLFSEECMEAAEYTYLWEHAVNPKHDSLLINIVVPFFPFDSKSKVFISRVEDVLGEEESKFNARSKASPEFDDGQTVQLFLNGFQVGPNAIQRQVFGVYPTLCAVTLGGVFLALGFLLRSYFVPLRLILTLFLPLGAVFGLAVLVYQDGILEWTGWASLSRQNGFFWSTPLLVITLVSGLCLDYDVLLISRIMEHRSGGYDIQAAIVKAVCETGGTIAAAGTIMFCAFGGLLLSEQAIIDHVGWLLSTSVLLDTFVVNTILVPALISVGDRFAWTPTKMPMHNLITLQAPEFPVSEVSSATVTSADSQQQQGDP